MSFCPCGSGIIKDDCCLKIIQGRVAATTAELLMRSRYCAYAIGDAGYLMSSWHISTRPAELDLSEPIEWLALQIKKTRAGGMADDEGWVEFIARYKMAGRFAQIHEMSHFVFELGRWFYVDGEMQAPDLPGRNSPCPCGSGAKFKRCCGD